MTPTQQRPRESEAQLVGAITDALHALGYKVLRCQQFVAAYAGSDKGLPDLWIAHPRPCACGRPLWLGMEVKTATGKVSAEQQALADAGLTVIVRTPQEAISAASQILGWASECRPEGFEEWRR